MPITRHAHPLLLQKGVKILGKKSEFFFLFMWGSLLHLLQDEKLQKIFSE